MNSAFQQQVAASFGKAAHRYLTGARLQQQVALDALALLSMQLTAPCPHLLDLGCGPGWIHPDLSKLSPQLTAVDLSQGMLDKAAESALAARYVQADAAQLPFDEQSFDAVFSSLMLQWSDKPRQVLAEVGRVLRPGGHAIVATLIEGTLTELTQAFATLDDRAHVNRFLPLPALQQAAQDSRVQGMQWQWQAQTYPLYYPDVFSLAHELKTLGANQVADRSQRGLTGKAYWQTLAQAYERFRTAQGLTATYQVVFLVGGKSAKGQDDGFQ